MTAARRRTRAVEHAVEHVLDFPAELAQQLGADQAAAALEGVEHAADGAQALHVVGRGAPCGQQLAEVDDFLVELLQEDFADIVVDIVAGRLETALGDGLRDHCHGDRRLR